MATRLLATSALSRSWLTALLLATAPAVLTPPAVAADTPRPDITIHQNGDRTVREYRIHGRLYAIRIIADDRTTTLIDSDGDGNFQHQAPQRGAPEVPDWVLSDR